jgi:hypothetical protein
MSGFSMGAGLAAVDIAAKFAKTFFWWSRHLEPPNRFRDPNIFFDCFTQKLKIKSFLN